MRPRAATGRQPIALKFFEALAALAILTVLTGCSGSPGDRYANTPRLYVTSGATDEVLHLDPRNGHLIGRTPLDRRRSEIDEPHGIVVAPDARHWYVTLSHGEPTLWKFELADDRLVGRLNLGTPGAARIGLTPDGRRAFIPDYYRSGQGRESGLAVVNLADLSIVDRPIICPAPHDAQVDPAGRRVAVACSLSDEVVLLDAATLEILSRFFTGSAPGPPGEPRLKPLNLVWSHSGDTLYVGLFNAGEVAAFDAEGNLFGRTTVGDGPAQLALTADGRTLIVANRNDASVSFLDTATLRERSRVEVERPHPHGIALDAEGRTAFISYEGDTRSPGGVVAIDVHTSEVLWAAEAGSYTLGIAYAAPKLRP